MTPQQQLAALFAQLPIPGGTLPALIWKAFVEKAEEGVDFSLRKQLHGID